MDDLSEHTKQELRSFSSLAQQADEDDEILDFQPMKTAFEKSMDRQAKTRKTFGSFSRTKSGESSSSNSKRGMGRFQIQRSIKQAFLGSSYASREALDQESGILADESSPEPMHRGHTLSEDEVCDFADLIPVPFLGMLQPEVPQQQPIAKSAARKSVHLRSASTVQHRSRPAVFHSRSASSIHLQPPPQIPSSRRSLQRSHSLALGSPIGDNGISTPTVPWSPDGRENWTENVNLNALDAIEKESDHSNGREGKRGRGRRHSITLATSVSTVTRTTSSSSSLASSATHLPSDLNWLAPPIELASPAVDMENYHDSVGAFSALSQSSNKSPTDRSVASSSRKRGVSGSPISSDHEEWFPLSGCSVSADARRTRSRSRIFSPLPGDNMPLVPSLTRPSNDDPGSDSKRHRSELDYGGRGDAMDLDDDNSDDDQSERKSTPNSSFESVNMDAGKLEPCLVDPDDESSKMKRIIDVMPSYDDLNYLIDELNQQKLRQCRYAGFRTGDVWKVTTPHKVWTTQRRVAFSNWAKTYLSFTVRSVGMGFTYLQISKSRGEEVLVLLEAALAECNKMECKKDPDEQTLFSSLSSPKLAWNDRPSKARFVLHVRACSLQLVL
jgi:hypothetical protein